MTRILLYYHTTQEILKHTFYAIKKAISLYEKIYFLTHSTSYQTHEEGLQNEKTEVFYIPENLNWTSIFTQVNNNHPSYTSVTLLNDSCLGPFFDLEKIYLLMEAKNLDFWTLTNLNSIQVDFYVFSNRVICSKEFQTFLKNLNKWEYKTIQTQLIPIFKKLGFTVGAHFPIDVAKNGSLEETKSLDLLLKQGLPFVNIESFLFFPHPKYLKTLIHEITKYDTILIEDCITKAYNPNLSLKVCNKFIPICESQFSAKLKIGIHIHAYNLDHLPEILKYIAETQIPIEIIFTTDTLQKKAEIQNLSKQSNVIQLLKEILVLSNRGRDVYPWLEVLKSKNSEYEILGHFHIKKSSFLDSWIVESWSNEIYSSMLKGLPQIIKLFQENAELGIVVPEIPLHLQNMLGNSWGITIYENQVNCNTLWKKMQIPKQIDFTKLSSVIMPYGNMYWCRPKALKPLLDLNLKVEDFPEEPFPRDGSIAHAIERLPVYITWAMGYDYRVLAHNDLLQSYFEREELTKKLTKQIEKVYKQSWSYRVGFYVVHPWKIPNFLLRKLLKLFKKREL